MTDFQERSERIKNPKTIVEKLDRIKELEKLQDTDDADPKHYQELHRLRRQTKGFDVIHGSGLSRKHLDDLDPTRRREILNTTPMAHARASNLKEINPRHYLFGFRPGRLRREEEELVETFRVMQKIRKTLDEFNKEASNG